MKIVIIGKNRMIEVEMNVTGKESSFESRREDGIVELGQGREEKECFMQNE
jgi:hypothetical protein